MEIKDLINSTEFKEKLLEALKSGKMEDYYYDGEDEIPYTWFDEDLAIDEVLNVIKSCLNLNTEEVEKKA